MASSVIRHATLAGLVVTAGSHAETAPSIELYDTFHSMGLIVTVDSSDDLDQDAVAAVSYRTGAAPFASALDLVRIDAARFVGSLFWLDPGTSYDVRVVFEDPGDVLHGVTVQQAGATRSEIVIPPASVSRKPVPGTLLARFRRG